MNDPGHPHQRRVFEIILEHDGLERAPAFVVAQLDARRIERNRARLGSDSIHLALGDKQKLGLAVYKARDQPRTGYAVNVDVRTRNPLHLNLLFADSSRMPTACTTLRIVLPVAGLPPKAWHLRPTYHILRDRSRVEETNLPNGY
jgi:hypothetical protein